MMLFATTEPTFEPERPKRLGLADITRHFRPGPSRRFPENLRLVLAQGGRRTCAVPTAVFLNHQGAIRVSTTLVRFRSLSVLPEDFALVIGRDAD